MPSKSTAEDPYDFPAREQREADQQSASELKRKVETDDLRWLMGHPAGRRIAGRLLEFTGVRRTTFNPSGSVMSFNEGKRTVGLWFEGELLEVVPEGYFKLLKEYASE